MLLSGCTTTTDHHYVFPAGLEDAVDIEVAVTKRLGMRALLTRGSMNRSQRDGGLPPDSVVQDEDTILADSERVVGRHHQRGEDAMVQIALAPCSPFSVTPELMRATAELAERLDVRLHTHLAEDPDEDTYAARTFGKRTVEHFEDVGWCTDRSWVAHCIYPNPAEVSRLGRAGVGVAHCPSSNMLIGGGGSDAASYKNAASGVTARLVRSSIGTTSRARAWVAPSTTSGANPASWASSQRDAQRHHRSPGLSPANPHSVRGVERSLPTLFE